MGTTIPSIGKRFDLRLNNPEDLDRGKMYDLLQAITEASHRGLTLNYTATEELKRWFDHPDTPLRSGAYVLLSNWFMTGSGDRSSMVAARCEALWDALFPCRPEKRLSSPRQNYKILPAEFESFWRRVLESQGEATSAAELLSNAQDGNLGKSSRVEQASATPDRLRATVQKDGLHCEVEGSAKAVAEFMRMVSKWSDGN